MHNLVDVTYFCLTLWSMLNYSLSILVFSHACFTFFIHILSFSNFSSAFSYKTHYSTSRFTVSIICFLYIIKCTINLISHIHTFLNDLQKNNIWSLLFFITLHHFFLKMNSIWIALFTNFENNKSFCIFFLSFNLHHSLISLTTFFTIIFYDTP